MRLPVIVNVYNSQQASLLLDRVAARLRAGDVVALVNGNGGRPLDQGLLQRWVQDLSPQLPEGVAVSHHTSGLENVQRSAKGSPLVCSSLLYDYEPAFEPEFSWDFASTLNCFRNFASTCRQAHRQAVGYPTGRAILETDLLAAQWDYGELRACVDRLIVQTQHWAHLGWTAWDSALAKLEAQFLNRGWNAQQLSVQISIGSGPNAVDGSTARAFFEDAGRRALGGVYLWWSPEAITDLVGLLD
jgi:hypothetical protein